MVKLLASVLAGLAVGGIIHEAILSGHDFLRPGMPLSPSWPPFSLSWVDHSIRICLWLLAVVASALMASGLAGTHKAGWISALVWLLPIGLISGLSGEGLWLLVAGALTCLTGALIAQRVQPRP